MVNLQFCKSQARPIVVHFHIFKNAGTTIDWILQKNFGANAIKFDDLQKPGNVYPPEKLLQVAIEYQEAKSVSSHQIRFPLPKNENYVFLPIVFVRHPIDRAVSVFIFTKKENRNDEYHNLARNSNLRQFIRANMKSKEHRQLKDSQTRWLAQEIKEFDPELRLSRAIENTSSAAVLGVVDRIDESLVVAEEVLKPYFPGIDMAYVIQNVSTERPKTFAQRLDEIKEQVGKGLLKRLEEKNEQDFAVYSHANKELDSRIAKIHQFKEKLADFKKRCDSLTK